MKKLLSIILAVLMIVTMIPIAVIPASAAENESNGVIYCDLGPWATPPLTALILYYSDDDNSGRKEIVMEEVSDNIWKAAVSTNNPAGWKVQFMGYYQSSFLSSIGTMIPAGKNCFRITEYNSSSKWYDGVWYQYPCTSHDYKDGICACGEVCFHVNYTDGKCDVCSYECPHDNYTMGICNECNYLCPHSFTEFNETVAPKCEETGWEEAYCDYCNIRLEQEIPALEHDWVSGGVERPSQNIDLSWSDGYYYDSCKNDATHTKITGVAKRGDYDTFNALLAQVKGYQTNAELTDEAAAMANKAINSNWMFAAGYIPQNLIENELNVYIGQLKPVAEAIEAGIADGTMLKADYTEIDEAVAGIDEALENATITDKMSAEIEDIKAELEALKENENATMADVNKLLDRAEAIAETMDNCANGVHSFITYEEVTAPECGKAGLENATCANGCGATDEKEVPALEHIDKDGNYICDHGCGHEFEKTEEPTDDSCDRCGEVHDNFFARFFCFLKDLFAKILTLFGVTK